MIYPANFEQKIGFDEIRSMLKKRCSTALAREKVDAMDFTSDRDAVECRLARVVDLVGIVAHDDSFPEMRYRDTRPHLAKVRLQGSWMDEAGLFDLRCSLEASNAMAAYFAKEEKSEAYPALALLAEGVPAYPEIVRAINRIIDGKGSIKDSASPELARIRSEISASVASISRTLNALLRRAKTEGLIDGDVTPALRDGRLVIPVAPGLKKRIQGIVHDESASGKTVYIEPVEVVNANNRIRELEADERREIVRILTAFADSIRPDLAGLLAVNDYLAEMDFIAAKASFSRETGAVKPSIETTCGIDWSMAVHPLLMLSLRGQGKQVVPLDLQLDASRRILVISGPNAGGKSVCLKTVGLLQYMLQCGMPVTMSESSHAGLFESIFIDIGDEQSIENNLSTYSSHLMNMKNMIKSCGKRSLLLIDEFGAGTEPQIGGAIAEAVLKRFNEAGAFGVITTHYHNLKRFADENEGIVNGAMLYDRNLLEPLFQLRIGNPGSSFAIEIARKTGLPAEVIDEAVKIAGNDYVNAEKYVQDIIRDKRYWENKRHNIRQREKQIEETIARYEKLIEELRNDRREIMAKAREQAAEIIKKSNATVENTIRVIKETQAEREATRKARAEIDELRLKVAGLEAGDEHDKALSRKIEKVRRRQQNRGNAKSAVVRQKPEAVKPLTEGDTVKIKGQTTVGRITQLRGATAIVQFGMVEVNVKLENLQRAAAATGSTNRPATFISQHTQDEIYDKRLKFKQEIDVRGMRGNEAVQAVTHFIDDALQVGASRVRILHGTGNGILRTLVRSYLATVPGVRSCNDEHVEMGGAGITVVDLD